MSGDITPFKIDIGDDILTDLKERLKNTRWPEKETVDGWSQGIPLAYTQELANYWLNDYDWRSREARLNAFDQFTTRLDGIDFHFIHERSPHSQAKPLVMTHGWPGSIVEFQKVIAPLTDPVTHGGNAEDAFHVVCPTLPGYGFSGKPTAPGWSVEKIAETWDKLMLKLGYDKYFAQGGDWGAVVTAAIGMQNRGACEAIHLNMVFVEPDPTTMEDLTPLERSALEGIQHYQNHDSGYSKQQSTRPQTIGYALADSPVGQMAWIAEKFWSWMDCDGHPENILTKDELLDNIMLYWCTTSPASSARLYWESFNDISRDDVKLPTGCSIYPKEIFRASRRWAERRFKNIVYWNELPKGGHFAAFEQPEVFVDEVRKAFRAAG